MRIAICDDLHTERQKVIDELKSIINDFSVNEFNNGNELLESHGMLKCKKEDLARIDKEDMVSMYVRVCVCVYDI